MKIHNYGNDYAFQLKQKQIKTTEVNAENPVPERPGGNVGTECQTACEEKEEAQKENESGDRGCPDGDISLPGKTAKKKRRLPASTEEEEAEI